MPLHELHEAEVEEKSGDTLGIAYRMDLFCSNVSQIR
tara:strand:- start:426 stop:536 length:111 start_codon:yes stop_codon:yes gene_type:complete